VHPVGFSCRGRGRARFGDTLGIYASMLDLGWYAWCAEESSSLYFNWAGCHHNAYGVGVGLSVPVRH
jgi:hypothetical protein